MKLIKDNLNHIIALILIVISLTLGWFGGTFTERRRFQHEACLYDKGYFTTIFVDGTAIRIFKWWGPEDDYWRNRKADKKDGSN